MKLPEKMSAKELAKLLDKADLIELWIKGVRAMAIELIEDGVAIQGWKLVPKKGMKRWKDETAIKERLSKAGLQDFCIGQLVSPTQVGKLCKAQGIECEISDLVTQESSGVNLVREDDRRASANASAANDFAGFSGKETI